MLGNFSVRGLRCSLCRLLWFWFCKRKPQILRLFYHATASQHACKTGASGVFFIKSTFWIFLVLQSFRKRNCLISSSCINSLDCIAHRANIFMHYIFALLKSLLFSCYSNCSRVKLKLAYWNVAYFIASKTIGKVTSNFKSSSQLLDLSIVQINLIQTILVSFWILFSKERGKKEFRIIECWLDLFVSSSNCNKNA